VLAEGCNLDSVWIAVLLNLKSTEIWLTLALQGVAVLLETMVYMVLILDWYTAEHRRLEWMGKTTSAIVWIHQHDEPWQWARCTRTINMMRSVNDLHFYILVRTQGPGFKHYQNWNLSSSHSIPLALSVQRLNTFRHIQCVQGKAECWTEPSVQFNL